MCFFKLRFTLLSFVVVACNTVHAEPAKELEAIEVISLQPSGSSQSNDTAFINAPSYGDIHASEPRSIVDRKFAKDFLPPGSDYGTVVQNTPGMLSISPNGPGLSESKLSFRGFQDGFYGMTFDGIPFGDSNDATHHSTSYFPSQFLGDTTVTRSPGSAESVGFATFGGNIGLTSKPLDVSPSSNVYGSIGSRNTRLAGVSLDTGSLDGADGLKLRVDAQQLASDGFQTNAGIRRDSIMVKADEQINADVKLTALATYTHTRSAAATGITDKQRALYGEGYGLGTDPTKGSFAGFNTRDRTADLAYIGADIRTESGLKIVNKLYTSGYQYGPDYYADTTDTAKLGNQFGPPGNQDVVGAYRHNRWRTVGNLLQATKEFEAMTVRSGIWIDRTHTTRFRQSLDFSAGDVPVAPSGMSTQSINYDSSGMTTTVQPYMEVEVPLSKRLKLTSGLRYAYFRQAIDERPDKANFTVPTATGGSYRALLPSAALHFMATKDVSLYAQYAAGIMMPPTALYDVRNNGAIKSLPEAQRTKSYQIGGIVNRPGVTLSWDTYYVDFNNAITSSQDATGETVYTNNGGVIYRGIEGEANVVLGKGFNLYLNATANRARTQQGNATIAYAPNSTQVAGLFYEGAQDKISVFARRIGSYYAGQGSSAGAQFHVASYTTMDFTASRTIRHPSEFIKSINLQVGLNNVLGKHAVTDVFSGIVPTYNFLAGRNLFIAANLRF